jgi:hypothetical protein
VTKKSTLPSCLEIALLATVPMALTAGKGKSGMVSVYIGEEGSLGNGANSTVSMTTGRQSEQVHHNSLFWLLLVRVKKPHLQK